MYWVRYEFFKRAVFSRDHRGRQLPQLSCFNYSFPWNIKAKIRQSNRYYIETSRGREKEWRESSIRSKSCCNHQFLAVFLTFVCRALYTRPFEVRISGMALQKDHSGRHWIIWLIVALLAPFRIQILWVWPRRSTKDQARWSSCAIHLMTAVTVVPLQSIGSRSWKSARGKSDNLL